MSTVTVLLVDDDSAHRMLAVRALARAKQGVTVLEAENLGEGEKKLSSQCALAIVDFNLGDERGIDLIACAKKRGITTPFIVVSTSDQQCDIDAGYAAGAACFIVKDPDPQRFQEQLLSAVKFFLK